MEISTLRAITTELCGRSVNPAIEEHLPQYAKEVAGVLAAVRAAALTFPTPWVLIPGGADSDPPPVVFAPQPATSIRPAAAPTARITVMVMVMAPL